jgi:hypothetical protein
MVGLTPVVLTASVQNGVTVLGQQYAMADSTPQLATEKRRQAFEMKC